MSRFLPPIKRPKRLFMGIGYFKAKEFPKTQLIGEVKQPIIYPTGENPEIHAADVHK
jgi:hypothetical protein